MPFEAVETREVSHKRNSNSKSFKTFLMEREFVVVMTRVELWKARQEPASQGHTVKPTECRIVRVEENVACHRSTTDLELNFAQICPQFSTLLPTLFLMLCTGKHLFGLAIRLPTTFPYIVIPSEARNPGGMATNPAQWEHRGTLRNYCRASSRRVMVRFKSLSDRRISSILLIECRTVV